MRKLLLTSLLALSSLAFGLASGLWAFSLLPGWPVEIQEPGNKVPVGPKINYFKSNGEARIVIAVPGSTVRCYNLQGELEWAKHYSHDVYDISIWGDYMAFPETDWEGLSYSIHLLSLSDQREVLGWPRPFSLPFGTCPVMVTLYDSNGDDFPEIFFSLYNDTLVHALDRYGNELLGWPAVLEDDVAKGYSLSVEDIDGDDKVEVTALGTETVQVFSASGEIKDGFPVRWSEESFTNVAAPVVMDIDMDGCMEIIVATCGIDPHRGTVRAFKCNGSNPWNYQIKDDYFHSPVAVFTHNEVTYIAAETERGRLHLLNENGELQPGWPIEKEGHGDGLAAVEVMGCPAVASGCNVNVAQGKEVESYLYFHTLEGSPLAGTPLALPGFTNFAVPTFFDSLMVVASFRVEFPSMETVNTVHLFEADFTAHHWPMYGHDPQNSNNYHSREVNVAVEDDPLLSPRGLVLSQNYPNPFNATTRIDYQLPSVGHGQVTTVRLDIYDILGRTVRTIMDRGSGSGSILWDASQVPSGVYFYMLTAGESSRMRRMTILK